MADCVLIVAAHPDDEVLGCGGTIALMSAAKMEVHVVFFTNGVSARLHDRASVLSYAEARKKESLKAQRILGVTSSVYFDFPDNGMDSIPIIEVAKPLERVIQEISPTRIFTHYPFDVNTDHRRVTEAVEIACRPQGEMAPIQIFYYETLSSTEWVIRDIYSRFVPNTFVDIVDVLDKKLEGLRAYGSELRDAPHSRSEYGVTAQAQWRGLAIGSRAAEAFVLTRQRLSFGTE